MSTLDDARAWIASAVDAHDRGEVSRAASAARIGTALAALAQAEHVAGQPPAPDRASLAPLPRAANVRTVHEAFQRTRLPGVSVPPVDVQVPRVPTVPNVPGVPGVPAP